MEAYVTEIRQLFEEEKLQEAGARIKELGIHY
jgi:hypothetical protein